MRDLRDIIEIHSAFGSGSAPIIKNLVTPDYRNLKHTNVPYDASYYTYSEMVHFFIYEVMIAKDLAYIKEKFKKVNINTQMPFKKKLMRTRQEMLGASRPMISVNTAIFTDNEDSGFMPTPFFNTDVTSSNAVDEYSDSVIYGGNNIENSRVDLRMIVKRGTLNIELTILDDHQPIIEMIKDNWNKVRYRNHVYTEDCRVKGIIPFSTILNLVYSLGMVDKNKPDDLMKYSYREMYEFLLPFVDKEIILLYERDNGTGKHEVLVAFDTELMIRPDLINLSGSDDSRFLTRDYTLTRSFMVEFNMPSMFVLRDYEYIPKDLADKLEDKRTEAEKGKQVITAIASVHHSPKELMDVIDESKYKMVASADYRHDNDTKQININILMERAGLVDWYNDVKDIGANKFFSIVFKENGNDVPESDYNMNYDTMLLTYDKISKKKFYDIYLYADMKEHNDYLQGIGYNKK